MRNVLLIVNPVAGRKKANSSFVNKIVKLFFLNKYRTKLFTTDKKGKAIKIVEDNAAETDRIICCGGDGTLNEIITGLSRTGLQIPIGYIPTGTTNDLARSLELPKAFIEAARIAISGTEKSCDIGYFNNERYFSYVASFGAFTKTSYATPQWLKNLIGRSAYIFSGLFSTGNLKSHKLKVVADNKKIEGDFVFGSVSNSTVIAGIIKIPKQMVSFDDGKFEVMLIKSPKSTKALRKTVRCILKQQYDEEYMHFFKASEISFEFENETAWTIDGEFAGMQKEVKTRNMQCQTKIVVPSENQEVQYQKISHEQAKIMIDSGEPCIVLDVRTDDEFKEKRIEGAVLIPDFEIGTRAEIELPDKSVRILIYCRSGRRSAIAANLLMSKGYKNVFDFGGIIDWPFKTTCG